MKLLRYTLLILSLFLFSLIVLAKDSKSSIFSNETVSINIEGGLNYNFNASNIGYFKNGVTCGTFKDGDGWGGIFNASFEYLVSDLFFISLGANYINRSSEFILDTNYLFRNYDNKIKRARFQNSLQADLHYLEIIPDIRFVLFSSDKMGLRLLAGTRIFFPIKNHFEQRETITNTTDVFFIDENQKKTSSRLIAEGEFGNINEVGLGMVLGLQNALKIGNNLSWTQQIRFDYNFTDVVANLDWRQGSINFMTGLRYSFHKSNKIDTLIIPDEIVKPHKKEILTTENKTVISPVLKVRAIGLEGELQQGSEFLATAPLVNAIFFKHNDTTLSKDLHFDKLKKEDYFRIDPIEQHFYILPRIVTILQENPQAHITLEGASAGKKFEDSCLKLARKRAEIVKKTLVELGANENQIKVKARLKPRFPSNSKHKEGVEENQRVDIILHNAHFQEYTSFIQFVKLVGKSKYSTKILNTSALGNLYSMQADSSIQVSATGKWNEYCFDLTKQLKKGENSLVDEIVLSVAEDDKIILDTLDLKNLPTRIVETDYSKFKAIIRFSYNSSRLSEENKQLLQQLVTKIPKNHTIQILGSTDALGGDKINSKLSQKRSKVTSDYINSLVDEKFQIETGMNTEKFDETTPVGRFLNRCIIIRIIKIK